MKKRILKKWNNQLNKKERFTYKHMLFLIHLCRKFKLQTPAWLLIYYKNHIYIDRNCIRKYSLLSNCKITAINGQKVYPNACAQDMIYIQLSPSEKFKKSKKNRDFLKQIKSEQDHFLLWLSFLLSFSISLTIKYDKAKVVTIVIDPTTIQISTILFTSKIIFPPKYII